MLVSFTSNTALVTCGAGIANGFGAHEFILYLRNDEEKNDKTTIYKTLHRKLKIEQLEPY
jgi:hypothetical protein